MNASAWAKDRSRSLVTGLTVAGVVIAVVLIAWLLYSRRTTNAAESIARALAVHDAIVANPLPALPPGAMGFTTEDEKDRRAYEALEKAANEYPSYNGDLARYLAATHQLRFEPEKAEATLKELASKGGEIGPQAQLALAERYEATGKNDQAVELYKKLKAAPGPVAPALIDFNLARTYEAAGKTQEAVELYFSIASNSTLRSSALGNQSVTRLGVIAPDKVDQLPAQEPASGGFPGGLGGPGGPGGMSLPVR